MIKIFIPGPQLAAVACFAADQDIRYYLNSVHVEATSKATLLVATNGHALGLYRCDASVSSPEIFTIPIFTVTAALKEKKEFYIVTIDDSNRHDLDGHSFASLEKFPDFRRAIPMNTTDEVAQFDFDLLGRFTKAARALGIRLKPNFHFRQNGERGALVQLKGHEGFVGVIMPWKLANEDDTPFAPAMPDWLWS